MDSKKCIVCGGWATDPHHLIMGSNRTLADEDDLTVNVCRLCHTRIHNNALIERKSRELGQTLYELKIMAVKGYDEDTARRFFLERYGRNYLG